MAANSHIILNEQLHANVICGKNLLSLVYYHNAILATQWVYFSAAYHELQLEIIVRLQHLVWVVSKVTCHFIKVVNVSQYRWPLIIESQQINGKVESQFSS